MKKKQQERGSEKAPQVSWPEPMFGACWLLLPGRWLVAQREYLEAAALKDLSDARICMTSACKCSVLDRVKTEIEPGTETSFCESCKSAGNTT